MFDIIIRNGTIIDGTGSPRFKADLAIKGSRIEKIGILKNEVAKKEINAESLFVAPGFIDINTDSDHQLTLFTQPGQKSFLFQGVTTIIGGNCGSSLAPLIKGSLLSIRKWTDPNQININWKSVKEFLEILEARKLGVNFGTSIGHSTIRRDIIGEEIRDLNEEEMKKMKFVIEEGLKEGALGISFGLAYAHSRATPEQELRELSILAKNYNALCSFHLRSEGKDFIKAVEEIYNLASYSNANIQINHFKSHLPYENNFKEGLNILDKSIGALLSVNFDVYPYTTGAFHLYTLLPEWVSEGGFEKMIERLKDPRQEKKAADELREKGLNLQSLIIAESAGQNFLAGKKIKDIAKNREISEEQTVCEILKESLGRTTVFMKITNEENIVAALKHPLSFISSNGTGYDRKPEGAFIHPRSFGAFPKFLSLIRAREPIGWEEAIKKITSGPALKIGLKNRGIIKAGFYADIVVFNPVSIEDKSSHENPFVYSEGIKYAILNGNFAIEDGNYKEGLHGMILRRI